MFVRASSIPVQKQQENISGWEFSRVGKEPLRRRYPLSVCAINFRVFPGYDAAPIGLPINKYIVVSAALQPSGANNKHESAEGGRRGCDSRCQLAPRWPCQLPGQATNILLPAIASFQY
ncbi:hypothetical protein MTP99_015611 [Tenebrio molitor]|jgi:hypothetical protein|nr:hypothetical protein MTP99_015611 [Tenebrio molitor]